LNLLSRKARLGALEGEMRISDSIESVLDDFAEAGEITDFEENQLRVGIQRSLQGFGVLQPLIDDESVEEIWINRPNEVRFAANGEHQKLSIDLSQPEIRTLLERLVRSTGRRIDRSSPFIDAQLENGFRLHAVIPDITKSEISINIRKFSKRVFAVKDLVSGQVLSESQAEFLVGQLREGSNILISGATQAGKTTLLAALIGSLEQTERIVSVEDTFELKCSLPDWVAMQTRPPSLEGKGEIDLRRLVKESLRMRPTRLVVGEVRGAEALDMLIALNSGIPGMCTIHANSSHEALQKLKTLPLLAGTNISNEFLEPVIRSSMDLFVHCKRLSNGNRRVEEICRVSKHGELSLIRVEK